MGTESGDAHRLDWHDDHECGATRELQQRINPDAGGLVEPVIKKEADVRQKQQLPPSI